MLMGKAEQRPALMVTVTPIGRHREHAGQRQKTHLAEKRCGLYSAKNTVLLFRRETGETNRPTARPQDRRIEPFDTLDQRVMLDAGKTAERLIDEIDDAGIAGTGRIVRGKNPLGDGGEVQRESRVEVGEVRSPVPGDRRGLAGCGDRGPAGREGGRSGELTKKIPTSRKYGPHEQLPHRRATASVRR